MLYILLLILKIIGWILLAILGILVLLVFIVLLIPVRYRIDGKCGGTPDSLYGNVKISWFAHLISGRISFEKRKLKWQIRIAFKTITSESGTKKSEKETVDKNQAQVKQNTIKEPETVSEKTQEKHNPSEMEKGLMEIPEISAEEPQSKNESKNGRTSGQKKHRRRFGSIIRGFCEKLKGMYQKIKYTWKTFCAKIKILLEKKDSLAAFVEDELHLNAFLRLKKEILRLCKFLMPQKLVLDLRFGFEDPYHTGQALAGLSVLYPLMGKRVSIIPDFEQRILKGTAMIKGRIHVLYFIIIAWNLFWDKNVRTTYKHIRAFKF